MRRESVIRSEEVEPPGLHVMAPLLLVFPCLVDDEWSNVSLDGGYIECRAPVPRLSSAVDPLAVCYYAVINIDLHMHAGDLVLPIGLEFGTAALRLL